MSRTVVEVVRCDFCEAEDTADEPVITKSYGWMGRTWETDVCPKDAEKVDRMFEDLTMNSRRVTETGTSRTVRTRRRPYEAEPRFNQWKSDQTGLFECPYSYRDDSGEHRCDRVGEKGFTTANGLAVHHSRHHGIKL